MSGDLLRAAVLGAVQGLTEFLPVSSSGHLVVVPAALGWPLPPLVFDAVVHLATAFSALLYFKDDWLAMLRFAHPGHRRMLVMIGLATIPGVLAGVLFQSQFEAMFESPRAAAGQLWITAGLLVAAEWLTRRRRESMAEVDAGRALAIGVGQAVAIVPGISRSASTMSVAMITGLDRPSAARFSFLMAPPILLGAGLYELVDATLYAPEATDWAALVVGAITAFIVGYAAIRWFMAWVAERSLLVFAAYTAIAGTVGVLYFR